MLGYPVALSTIAGGHLGYTPTPDHYRDINPSLSPRGPPPLCRHDSSGDRHTMGPRDERVRRGLPTMMCTTPPHQRVWQMTTSADKVGAPLMFTTWTSTCSQVFVTSDIRWNLSNIHGGRKLLKLVALPRWPQFLTVYLMGTDTRNGTLTLRLDTHNSFQTAQFFNAITQVTEWHKLQTQLEQEVLNHFNEILRKDFLSHPESGNFTNYEPTSVGHNKRHS